MVKQILTAAGVPFRRSRFPKPPTVTYAVYLDDITTDGADGMPPQIFRHDVSVELYSTQDDETTEAAIEAAISAQGIAWTKQDRYWLQDVQRYQTIYDFTYTDKEG